MKVIEGNETGFKPFSIKIETKEEAEMLWHYLNMDNDTSLQEYLRERTVYEMQEVDNFVYDLWKLVNNLHIPGVGY